MWQHVILTYIYFLNIPQKKLYISKKILINKNSLLYH